MCIKSIIERNSRDHEATKQTPKFFILQELLLCTLFIVLGIFKFRFNEGIFFLVPGIRFTLARLLGHAFS